jgi:hypothetical protein
VPMSERPVASTGQCASSPLPAGPVQLPLEQPASVPEPIMLLLLLGAWHLLDTDVADLVDSKLQLDHSMMPLRGGRTGKGLSAPEVLTA